MSKFAPLFLLLLVSCDLPRQTYRIKMARPDGTLHKEWTVKSSVEPGIATMWGGQSEVWIDGDPTNIVAPTGWLLTVEKEQ